MSGHSKWATTKRHKAAVDAKRGKLFSLLSKELTLAARERGGDPEFNPRLRTCMAKAKTANMPAENVTRAIKKGTGDIPGTVIEEMVFEGFGPGGIGVIVEVTTDNKNRAISEVRSTFSKNGGNLAAAGAQTLSFQRKGQFLIAKEVVAEAKLLEVVLENGAEDISEEEGQFEVLCSFESFYALNQALEKAQISCELAQIAHVPTSVLEISDESIAAKALHLLEKLEELEDVTNVYSNM